MEEIDDLWGAYTDRTVPFDRGFGGPDRRSSWCTFDHGVACGTDRSGTHGDHRKGTKVARAPLPCGRRARSDAFRPTRTYTLSAMGHDRVMSVIPLKADIHQCGLHVRLVPEADTVTQSLKLG